MVSQVTVVTVGNVVTNVIVETYITAVSLVVVVAVAILDRVTPVGSSSFRDPAA